MKSITILIAGLILPCTPVLKAQQTSANSMVPAVAQSTAWTTPRTIILQKPQSTIFTGDHRLYWKYRVPIAYGSKPLDVVMAKKPIQTLVIKPLNTRRSTITDVMLLSTINLPKTQASPTWKEWLLPPVTPPYRDHWRTSEPVSPRLDLVLFKF